MIFYFLSFSLGIIMLALQPHLPQYNFILSSIIISLIGISNAKLRQFFLLSVFFFCGLLWATWYAKTLLSFQLPLEKVDKLIYISGYIHSIPVHNQFGYRFDFELHEFEKIKLTQNLTIHIQLNLPQKVFEKNQTFHKLSVGQYWQLAVKLKRIHAIQNPGTFDYEAVALAHHLRATGKIISNSYNKLLADHWYNETINRIRSDIKDKINTFSPQSPWLLALVLGEHENITSTEWEVLRKTGTNHLMAIAGLHIGFIAHFTQKFITLLLRRIPILFLYYPLSIITASLSSIVAILYSCLAGFSLPTKRASVMLIIATLAFFIRRKINIWLIWSLSLSIILLINPLDVLTDSFWLSFFTIFIIVYGMHARQSEDSLWWKWGRVQWIIGLGLIPLSFNLFSECSLISFLANAITIPWLGFLILPFCFLGTLSIGIAPSTTKIFLSICDQQLLLLFDFLKWLSHFKWATLPFAIPNMFYFVVITGAVLILFLPLGTPLRRFSFLLLLPLFFLQYHQLEKNQCVIHILDVGQGLAVLIQTANHNLLYDTGGGFISRDMGNAVIIPYLRRLNVYQLDKVILSHGDKDHIGGFNSLLKEIYVKELVKSNFKLGLDLPLQHTKLCDNTLKWTWDGIYFQFLTPFVTSRRYQGNNSSCVLKVSIGKNTILLPGDIEKPSLEMLTKQDSDKLAANILLAPHHGSQSSLSYPFIQSVKPTYVIYSTGYQNQYHLPHPLVRKAYQLQGSKELNTVETGEITFNITKHTDKLMPDAYRIKHLRYWYD